MRRQTNKMQKRQLTFFLWSILILTGMLFGLVQLDRWIRPDVLAVCAQECRSAASVQIGESVHTVLQENGDTYSDFAVLLYDTNGNVTAVETLTTHINQIQAQLLTQINRTYKPPGKRPFPFPLAQQQVSGCLPEKVPLFS